jgi:hypothetical protein
MIAAADRFRQPRIHSVLPLASIVLLCLGALHPELYALQGMASGVKKRPGARIETNLKPIEVHFEDIALKAGLSSNNVSGAPRGKK